MTELPSGQRTVLAVDDSKIMQEMILRALHETYEVLVADNAVDALTAICHRAVDLLLLDVSMPDIDGLELCRTVRSMPQFKHLPIIMLTSRNSPFDKVQGRVAGATDYLTKPFEADQLRQAIGQILT
ncbi:response regulator [Prochlorothrix hollandica]|uniref:Regulator n=1 Tax=Prochlorothrix hollandica PCC 9006 = CALU 1027 TaxID=317619 RepID=A0A0M2Q004_PROHO|nr:response regulator [Prochlorothrix hollandica]KKI99966.1 regulator [Prochlorothrix hollandica PCC 9006 = CALU 1027]